MHPCVGAGGAGKAEWASVQCMQRFFDLRLYGNRVFLDLETAVTSSFISHLNKITAHPYSPTNALNRFR